METANPFTLSGKKILVTGASSGIGKCVAIECSKMGASVLITGRNENRLKETLALLKNDNHKIIVSDLADAKQIKETWKQECIPVLDGLVLCAGINNKTPVKFISEEKMDNIFKINFYAPVLMVQALLKNKKINSGASIVMISSIGTSVAAISNGLYAASKGALNSFMKVLALELSSNKIRVNTIQPGIIRTDMLKNYQLQDELESWERSYPLGRFGEPEDIAFPVIYLLSNAARWVTGSIFTIDGGVTLR
jgi:NAD(P)-dependent dehydrogenase (short-subunit alcohol dehydrogenase family)